MSELSLQTKTKKSIFEGLAEKFFKNYVGRVLEMATRGPVKFGFHSAHISQEKLTVKFIMASRLNHANFLAGNIDCVLCRIFKKKYIFKIICNEKESEEFDEYVILCFDIHIKRDNSESNTVDIRRQKKTELFSSTLTNINRERMKIKKITTELSKYPSSDS